MSKFTTLVNALQFVRFTDCKLLGPSNSRVESTGPSFNARLVNAPGIFRVCKLRIELGNCKSVTAVFIAFISPINGE